MCMMKEVEPFASTRNWVLSVSRTNGNEDEAAERPPARERERQLLEASTARAHGHGRDAGDERVGTLRRGSLHEVKDGDPGLPELVLAQVCPSLLPNKPARK